MRAKDFTIQSEAEEYTSESDQIVGALTNAGYENIGSGADATVWAKDERQVIKIIMPEDNATQAARVFKKFYEFCKSHQNLACVPKFIPIQGRDYIEFTLGSKNYMQISMERLSPIPGGSFEEALVWNLSDYATKRMSWDEVWDKLNDTKSWSAYSGILNPEEIIKDLWYLDDKQKLEYEILFKVMTLLYHTGNINKVGWDLHTENAMMRGNTIVITDPWFSINS